MFLQHVLKLHVPKCSSRHLWSTNEIEEAEEATIVFAADVIYSDDLTDLFFDTVKNLMSSGAKKVLLAPAIHLSYVRT
jgi:methyltransferase-like protein 22